MVKNLRKIRHTLPIYSYNFTKIQLIVSKLGIDIGGTNITLGLVNDNKLISSIQVPSFEKEWNLERTLSYLENRIDSVITPDVKGIGIGVPSVVDIRRGIVFDTANIPSWQEVKLKDVLENKYGIPVMVNNDSNCYALGAYMTYSPDRRPESLVVMTLGTGVGMGIVIDGKLYCGAHCGAGELACIPFKGMSLEEHCCKNFFIRAGLTPKEAYDRAVRGDKSATALFEEYGRNLGSAVCAILFAYDPQRVAIGGGIVKGGSLFRPAMMEYVRDRFPYRKTVEELSVDIMNDDCLPVIGAASL